MAIEKRVVGKRTSYLVRWRDPSGNQRSKSFDKKSQAERHLTATSHALLSGVYVDPAAGRTTVKDWSVTWMASRANRKPKTVASYESLLKSRVLPRWGDTHLVAVSHAQVVGWVAQMRSDGLSASRTRGAFHLLAAMLDDAVNDGRLARNPANRVNLPRLPTTERRYLTHAQVDDLADASGDYRTLVLTLAYLGLRWGDVTALRVRILDLMRGRLDVVEAVGEVNGKLIYGTPKNHQTRSVAVPRFLRDDLAAQVAGKEPPNHFVFTSPEGAVLRVQNRRRRCFDQAAAQVGLKSLVPHELRHTAASLAVASGANVKAVQQMLGHASAAMTLDVYSGLFADELDAVADRVDAATRAARAQRPARAEATVTPLTQRNTGS